MTKRANPWAGETTARCGSCHKHSLCHPAGEQMPRAEERMSKGGFAARNGQAIFRAWVGTTPQEPGPFLSAQV